MFTASTHRGYRPERRGSRDPRVRALVILGALAWVVVVIRLFTIQVLHRAEYAALAENQRLVAHALTPERGTIVVHDRRRSDGVFPIATNERAFTMYAVPHDIVDPARVARKLSSILGIPERALLEHLAKSGDPYEPLKRHTPLRERDAVLALHLPGIAAESELIRYYPDGELLAQVTGFVGEDERGLSGRYGIEGAYDALLAGRPGHLTAERDPRGRWILFGERTIDAPQQGANLTLTIEREVQTTACRALAAAVEAHHAASGSIVILNPTTGAIRALCGSPSFDPNHYESTQDLARFRSAAVVAAYEPGSVFKAVTMASAIDAGVVRPETTFVDAGSVHVGGFTITNTDGRVYGTKTMADVLRFSINTGAVFVAQHLGMDRFRSALDRFGFGARAGIELEGESPGDVGALAKREDVYLATASYGQGITVTPLQLATAYAAIANGGKLMTPYLVDTIALPDGSRRQTEPRVVRQVVSPRTATILQGMLVSVVKDGYPKRAGVSGYLIGGKTGTAQIPFPDRPGYSNDMIHTFVGFGPADHPTFAMAVRLDRPQTRRFADSTAAPLFGEIAKFLMQYDGIAPRE